MRASAVLPRASSGGIDHVTIEGGSSEGVPTGVSILKAARLRADGHIVVLGEGSDRGLTMMRFSAVGAPDTTLGTVGRTPRRIQHFVRLRRVGGAGPAGQRQDRRRRLCDQPCQRLSA
jgi:hypothetical protein